MAPLNQTTEIPRVERLRAKAAERAKVTDQIARMLWESGPMTAAWEGDGASPTWDEITEWRFTDLPDNAHPEHRKIHEAHTGYWLDTWHKAEALQALDADQSMTLARIMLDQAQRQQKDLELQLWRKVERATGYEPGSLTGQPGVKQRVFI